MQAGLLVSTELLTVVSRMSCDVNVAQKSTPLYKCHQCNTDQNGLEALGTCSCLTESEHAAVKAP
jgi:hypothetical protein